MSARLAWVLVGVTAVLVVADILVTAQYRSLLSEDAIAVHGFPFVDIAVLGCSVLGALILGRDSRHPIGVLLALVGFTSAFSLVAEAYGIWVVSEGGPGTAAMGGVSSWLASLFGGQLAISGLALMFLLVPDGRLLSRRWRPAVVVIALGVLCGVAALLTQRPTTYDIESQAEDIGPLAQALFTIGFLLISVGLVISVVSMLIRLRRSRGETRQQVRLIALAAGLVCVGVVNLILVQVLTDIDEQTWISAGPLLVSYMFLPILFGVAVLRYRLYDVEVILNRTLVVVLGTAFAAVGYTTIVVVVGKLVGPEGRWLSLLATALVAFAFQPLRRQVVRLADRLAYGSRAQPYEALADFSHRLAETPATDTLLPAVARAAGQALSATGAAAVLHTPGAPLTAAEWGSCGPVEEAHTVVVRHGRAELGSIRVWLPAGMRIRPSDVRLLEALADQTAVAFRNAALEAQLEAHVAELDRATRDLARSRARIIEADDAARREMEAAISRDVLPHLAAVPDGIARAVEANAAGRSDTGIDALVVSTNTALEALRELTRGLFPTQLARAGVEPALRSYLARHGLAGALHVDLAVAQGRFDTAVETSVYSCCIGVVREFTEVSGIELSERDGELVVSVRGTRRTPEDVDRVRGVRDRAEALGGSVDSTGDGFVVRIPRSGSRHAVLAGGPEL